METPLTGVPCYIETSNLVTVSSMAVCTFVKPHFAKLSLSHAIDP